MCMKYVNANVTFFSNVVMKDNVPVLYSFPFDGLDIDTSIHGEHPKIGEFYIVVQINILGTDDETVSDNLLNNREKLEVTVRLTKCSPDKEKQLGRDLETFVIDTKDSDKLISHACYDFLNVTRIIPVKKDEISLDCGLGHYVVKVLVRDPSTGKQSIQTMRKLNIAALKK